MDPNRITGGCCSSLRRGGFSLLEMMVVLAVLAGLMAIAWPALRRPLAQGPVQQATLELREQLGQCRHDALIHGELLLVRLEAGSSEIQIGTWQALLGESLNSARQGSSIGAGDGAGVGGNQPAADAASQLERQRPSTGQASAVESAGHPLSPPSKATPTTWKLTEDVVVERVELLAAESRDARGTERSNGNATDDGSIDFRGDSSMSGTSTSSDDARRTPSDGRVGVGSYSGGGSARSNSAGMREEREGFAKGYWYLPFLPNGQTQTARIVLRDRMNGRRAVVEIDGVTGMMESQRLPAAAPTQSRSTTNAGGAANRGYAVRDGESRGESRRPFGGD